MSLVHYFDKCFTLDSTCCEGSLVKLLVAFSFILTAKMLLPPRQAGTQNCVPNGGLMAGSSENFEMVYYTTFTFPREKKILKNKA